MQNSYANGELEYFRSLYPMRARTLQSYVDEACDKMEYKFSPMYDEYPDQMVIDQMCSDICARVYQEVPELLSEKTQELSGAVDVEEVEIYEATKMQQLPAWGPPPRPPQPPQPWPPQPPRPQPPRPQPPRPPQPWPPQPPRPQPPRPQPPRPPQPWPPQPPRPLPPGSGNNWLNDLVRIMLLNEIYRRRCQAGRC